MNLEDIARKAGVSRSTVSRVLNNERYVSEDVRERVQQVIDQEGFRPNPAARALVTRRSKIIGTAIRQTNDVFFGDNSYFQMLLQGVAEAVYTHDYAMLLWLSPSSEHRDKFTRRVSRDRNTDGVIITSVTHNDPLLANFLAHKRHFVMVETPPSQYADMVSYVTVDNVAAADEAVTHLIEIGRRRIATITGQMNIQDGIDRYEGYKRALHRAGLPLDPDLVVYGAFLKHEGYNGMKRLLPFAPDAIFAGGDTIAVGALEALAEAGSRVPEDVAVVGFDDLDVARTSGLTTVNHAVQLIGSTAASLLIDLIEGQLEHPQHVVLPTRLVIRRSTVAGA
ncbi:MAG: LacI family DNA-binding transcriptional regulator [Chloroflexota bacterium]|nr:LacI family DNA-binding transcriptional regulator [Chloroflexota bacterium]